MNISKKLIYLCATVLTAVLSVGCSQSEDKDDPYTPGFEEGSPTEVRITLSTRSGNQTRADGDGTPKDPTSSIELMHDGWWIVFVNNNGDVKLIKQSEIPLADRIKTTPSTVTDPNEGFEAETFKTILPSGTYRIYAFANIDPMSEDDFKKLLTKNSKGEWKLENIHLEHEKFVGAGKFKDPSNPQNDGMQWPASANIPMTGVMTKKIVKNTIEEAFNVEVVRAVAKVEFAFSNPSADEISLQNLDFGPITKDENISIVPNYDAIGICANNKVFDDVKQTGTLTFSSPFSLTGVSEKYTMGKFGFYCKESTPAEKGGPFNIKLKVKRNDEEKTYEYQTKTITYINRNDWILIPIKFNDWIVEWRLHFYPPIGGYPPVFSQSGSGDNITATVTTGGEFELYPYRIKRNGETTDYYQSVNWTVYDSTEDTSEELTPEQAKAIQVTVLSGNDDIFVTGKEPKVIDNPNINAAPAYNHSLKAFPKLIIGEIDPKKPGTAKVQIKFFLNNKDGENKDIPYADTEFTCTFTINNVIPTGS